MEKDNLAPEELSWIIDFKPTTNKEYKSVKDVMPRYRSKSRVVPEKTKKYIDAFIQNNKNIEEENRFFENIVTNYPNTKIGNKLYSWYFDADKSTKNSLNNLLNDDRIKHILEVSPDYGSTIIQHALDNNYDVENTIKSLIQQKFRFVRGFKAPDDKSILKKYALGFAPDTGGGRFDRLRYSDDNIGTNYRSNSLETAYAFSQRGKFDGTGYIAYIHRPLSDFDFSGNSSTWWDNNRLTEVATNNSDITSVIAKSTKNPAFKDEFVHYKYPKELINKLFLNFDRNNIRVKQALEYLNSQLPSMEVRKFSPAHIPLRHTVFEGPLESMTNERVRFYKTDGVTIDDLADKFNLNLNKSGVTTQHIGRGQYLFSLGNKYGGFLKK